MHWSYRLPERSAPTLSNWINPVWWLSDVQRYDSWSWWSWFKRNPCSNFLSVIVGVADVPRWFVARDRATIWSEDGKSRLAWTVPYWEREHMWASLRRLFLPRPLLSFVTKSHESAIGWKVDGSASITWRRLHAEEARP